MQLNLHKAVRRVVSKAQMTDEEAGPSPSGRAAMLYDWEVHEAQLLDEGMPEDELELPGTANIAPVEKTVVAEVWSRGRWLLGLLVLQSTSSFVLDSYQGLLKDHLVVTLFLTMLVGAGGNAGNQSAIKVIRGLATGTLRPNSASFKKVFRQQALVGLLLGAGLSVGGFARVFVTSGGLANSAAIATSLFFIVMTSVLTGTLLPFGMARVGVDPAHAGTSVQVVMDILGVLITCVTCHFVLDQLASGLSTVA